MKAADDTTHPNSFLALVAGLARGELDRLEAELCALLEWRLMPAPEDVADARRALSDDPLALGSFWAAWLQPPRPPPSDRTLLEVTGSERHSLDGWGPRLSVCVS